MVGVFKGFSDPALLQIRNSLLILALHDEEWVLWLDADVKEMPANTLEEWVGNV